MTAQARRGARRIDPKTRDMAEALARQSGVSLSDWAAALSAADDLRDAVLSDDGGAVGPGSKAERPEASHHPTDDLARLSRALERVSERVDAAETRSALAVSGVDKAAREALGRLEAGEREQTATAAHFEGAVDEVRAEQAKLAERLARIEADARGPRSTEALRSLEAALGTVAEQLYRGEGHTEESIANLRVRVERLEAEPSDPALMNEAALAILGVKGRLETLAGKIAGQEEAIGAVEQRSLRAIESMGAEVVEVSQSLIRRVQSAEARGAESIEQVGAEVSRVAATMDARLGRSDAIQAQALEKLGAEIERISERLAERIAHSDRRAGQAIDEVGDQVALITERLGQRQERATDDLGDRIRQSEERTAALLKEARETIAKLAGGGAPTNDSADVPIWRDQGVETAVAAPHAETTAEHAPAPDWPAPLQQTDAVETTEAFPAFRTAVEDEAIPLDSEDEQRTMAFEPLPEDGEATAANEADPQGSDDPDLPAAADGTSRARPAGAFAALYGPRTGERSPTAPASSYPVQPGPRSFTGIEGPIFTGLAFRPGKRRGGTKTAALGVGLAAAFGLALGGFFVAENEPHGGLVTRIAYLLRSPKGEGLIRPRRAGVGAGLPQEAVALSPTPLARPGSQNGEVAALYAAAVAKLEANDDKGVEALRHAADLGYAPAQFYLAKLYETGANGVTKDAIQSRQWTQKAAMGGDARAMHNLGLYEYEGAGGPKNFAAAAAWFQRAASLGLVDSQYNLGRLYESGVGVAPNTAEAYKWYLIASSSGDSESKSAAARVKAGLSPDARAVAERAAADFRPTAPEAAPTAAAANQGDANVVTAQRGLSALGYYQGPTDGAATPALKLALSAYQRDQGLPVTGALDPGTVSRLQTVNQ